MRLNGVNAVLLFTAMVNAAHGQGCLVAKASPWYWLTVAHIKAAYLTGGIKDLAACKQAVNAGSDLAKSEGESIVTDAAKGISNCACEEFFAGDPRLHPIPPPPMENLIAHGVYHVMTTVPIGNACWDRQNGESKDLTLINPCAWVGAQTVEIGHVNSSSPWYQLKVKGACVNIDEDSWNKTGTGVVHLLPCTEGANDNDQWAVVRRPNPWRFQFVSKRSGACIDLRDQGKTVVQQNICSDLPNQWWVLRELQLLQ
jgi:hypothetical protein